MTIITQIKLFETLKVNYNSKFLLHASIVVKD